MHSFSTIVKTSFKTNERVSNTNATPKFYEPYSFDSLLYVLVLLSYTIYYFLYMFILLLIQICTSANEGHYKL